MHRRVPLKLDIRPADAELAGARIDLWVANKELVELELRTYLNLRTSPEI